MTTKLLATLVLLAGLALGVTSGEAQVPPHYYDVTTFGAACDGSTDDTGAFAAAIAKAAVTEGTIEVPAGKTCRIGGTLNFDNTHGICLAGGSGAPAVSSGDAPFPRLVFTGSAGPLISFAGAGGLCVKNLYLQQTNSSFSGIFFEGAGAAYATFQNLVVRGANTTSCLISLNRVIDSLVDRVHFDNAQVAICGTIDQHSDFSNNITIRNSYFAGQTIGGTMIQNPGAAWTIGSGNYFVLGSGPTGPTVLSTLDCLAISFIGNVVTGSTSGDLLSLPSDCSLIVRGNIFRGNSHMTAIGNMRLGTLVAEGNTFEGVTAFSVSGSSGNCQPTGPSIVNADIGANWYVNSKQGSLFPQAPSMFTTGQGTVVCGDLTSVGSFQANGSVNFGGNLTVGGTLAKKAGAFKIDHPLDPTHKYLSHSFVESPEMENIYDGIVTLDENGEAVVKMPDYFEALNQDFHYHLSCIGGYAPVFIAQEMAGNAFRIGGGKPGLNVSWMVSGTRHDTYANAHRVKVEEDKPQ
jgi:hypothetical protein